MAHRILRNIVVGGVTLVLGRQLVHEGVEPAHHADPHTHQEDRGPFATRSEYEWVSSGSIAPSTSYTTVPRHYTRMTVGDVEID